MSMFIKGLVLVSLVNRIRLSEYTEVTGAEMKDGILTVNLEVILPEEKRPRKIKINSNYEENNDSNSTTEPELLRENT